MVDDVDIYAIYGEWNILQRFVCEHSVLMAAASVWVRALLACVWMCFVIACYTSE